MKGTVYSTHLQSGTVQFPSPSLLLHALNAHCHRSNLQLSQVSGLPHLLSPEKAAGSWAAVWPTIARWAHIHWQCYHHQQHAGRAAELSGLFHSSNWCTMFSPRTWQLFRHIWWTDFGLYLPVRTHVVSPSHKKDLTKDKNNKWAGEKMKLRYIKKNFIQQIAIIALNLHLVMSGHFLHGNNYASVSL